MLELILIVAAIGAFFIGYTNGSKEGAQRALSEQRAKVHAGMNPDSAFCRTYGVPGFYLADTSSALDGLPLITLSSANFLRLVARQRLSENATDDQIEAMKNKLGSDYLLATGMKAETVEALKREHQSEESTSKREV